MLNRFNGLRTKRNETNRFQFQGPTVKDVEAAADFSYIFSTPASDSNSDILIVMEMNLKVMLLVVKEQLIPVFGITVRPFVTRLLSDPSANAKVVHLERSDRLWRADEAVLVCL